MSLPLVFRTPMTALELPKVTLVDGDVLETSYALNPGDDTYRLVFWRVYRPATGEEIARGGRDS